MRVRQLMSSLGNYGYVVVLYTKRESVRSAPFMPIPKL